MLLLIVSYIRESSNNVNGKVKVVILYFFKHKYVNLFLMVLLLNQEKLYTE